ncbi:MAG: hypothetical protein RLY71_110 [Pseudomonadota bacterium]|jgi:hypothetical protein
MITTHLADIFSQLTDEELVARVAAGGLTEEAQVIAIAELQSRQIPIPPVVDATAEPAEEEYLGDMVMLERGLTPTEAHMLCACLQAAGIQADAGDANLVQANSLLSIAVGGACVRVHSAQTAEAQEILAAFRRGDFALGDDFDPGEAPV